MCFLSFLNTKILARQSIKPPIRIDQKLTVPRPILGWRAVKRAWTATMPLSRHGSVSMNRESLESLKEHLFRFKVFSGRADLFPAKGICSACKSRDALTFRKSLSQDRALTLSLLNLWTEPFGGPVKPMPYTRRNSPYCELPSFP